MDAKPLKYLQYLGARHFSSECKEYAHESGSKLVYKERTLNWRVLVVIELLYVEHQPNIYEMGVDQVAINRGRNSFSCFLPPRLSGGPEDGRQANLVGTVLPHK